MPYVSALSRLVNKVAYQYLVRYVTYYKCQNLPVGAFQGDLLRHINRSGPLTGPWIVSSVLRPTLQALDYLHNQVGFLSAPALVSDILV